VQFGSVSPQVILESTTDFYTIGLEADSDDWDTLERAEREAAAALDPKAQLRRSILAKLSLEEIEALGIDE
jgi:hypothetical protein